MSVTMPSVPIYNHPQLCYHAWHSAKKVSTLGAAACSLGNTGIVQAFWPSDRYSTIILGTVGVIRAY